MRDYLIYTSAGLDSNVHLWAKSPDRDYDVWVTNYSDVKDNLREYADYYNEAKGLKFPNFKKLADEHGEFLRQYKAIMVADDDIRISAEKLNRMFHLFEQRDLWIVTPAYSRFGKISHRTTERKLTSRYRYTNFAEVTCPIIRTDKLFEFMDVYDGEVVGYGVDWWYLNFFGRDVKDKIIISDEDYCINPRDQHKPSQTREINKVTSCTERESLWRRKSRRLGMDPIEPKVFSSERRSLIEIAKALPTYLAEQVYWLLFRSKYSKRAKQQLKLVLKRA